MRLATPVADNARRLRAYRDVGPCGLPSRSALGAILPLHDVRYHASALSQAKLALWRSDGGGKFFSANEQVPAGGARRDRTDDLLLAKQALSQLSYGPGQDAKAKRLKEWWAWEDSNFRPHAYQARALTN